MPTEYRKIKIRRDVAADFVGVIPTEGEFIYYTDDKDVFIGDGVTPAEDLERINVPTTTGAAAADVLTVVGGVAAWAPVANGITAGRVLFAGASGVLASDADMTFATDTLTVAKAVVSSGTASSSTSTGALVISGSGGIGVGGALYVGGLVEVANSVRTRTASGTSTQFEVIQTGVASWQFRSPTSSSNLVIRQNDTSDVLTLSTAGNATLAGTLTASGTGTNTFSGAVTISRNTATLLSLDRPDTATFSTSGVTFNQPDSAGTNVAIVSFQAYKTANTVGAVNGSLTIVTRRAGTLTNAFTVDSEGTASVLGTTVATSTSTGALIVSGGTGIAGNLHAGGSTIVFGNASATTEITINSSSSSRSKIVGEWAGTSAAAAMLFQTTNTGGTFVSALRLGANGAGQVSALGTTASTSLTTGAFLVAGGAGIAGAVWGGSFNASHGIGGVGLNIVASTIPTAGSQRLGAIHAGASTDTSKAAVQFLSTQAWVAGSDTGSYITLEVTPNGSTTRAPAVSVFSTHTLVAATTTSTSTTTGALVVSGGVGIAGAIFIGGSIVSTGTGTHLIGGAGCKAVIGYSTTLTTSSGVTPPFQVIGTGDDSGRILMTHVANNNAGPAIYAIKTRGGAGSYGAGANPQTSDTIFAVLGEGADGAGAVRRGASMVVLAGSNWSTANTHSIFIVSLAGSASTTVSERFRVDADGITSAGMIQSASPSGGTQGQWKLGIRVAAAVAFDATQYIQLDVGGTLYKLAVAA